MNELPSFRKLALLANESGGPLDGELLQRYVSKHDQGAFELLVWRYSDLVLRICWSRLRDRQLAEDVAQAVFLVLSKSAPTFGADATIAGWIHTIATRIAIKAYHRAAKSRAAPYFDTQETRTDPSSSDDAALLHDEVTKLPERYRIPIVLAYFDGLTHQEIARRTGLPKGTVDSQIYHGLQQLKKRLTRRGVTLSAGLAAVTAASGSWSKLKFVEAVIRSATAFRTGGEGCSATVRELTSGALRSMYMQKIQAVVGVVVSCSVLAFGGAMALGAPRELPQVETSWSALAPAKKEAEIPEKVIAEYESRGAWYGGFVPDPDNPTATVFEPGHEAARKGLPGFCWYRTDSDKTLVSLPPINRPFGIEIDSQDLAHEGLNQLEELKNLEMLIVKNSAITDESMKVIEKMKHLKCLHLNTPRVTVLGLKQIAQLKQLTHLSVVSSSIDTETVVALANLEHLTSLSLVANSLSDAHVKAIVNFKNLSALSLTAYTPALTVASAKDIAKMKTLTYVHLTLMSETFDDVKQLCGIQNLTSLELHAKKITENEIDELSKFHHLTKLALNADTMSDADVKGISKLDKLKSLMLRSPQVTDASTREIAKLQNLTSLNLCRSELTDVGVKELVALRNLTTLVLSSNQLTDECTKGLGSLKNLRSLVVTSTALTDEGMKELAKITGLESLQLLSSTNITADGVRHLTSLKLKSLWVSPMTFTDTDALVFAAFKELQRLGVTSDNLTDMGANQLKSLKNLSLLTIGSPKVSPEGGKALKKDMPRCRIYWPN